MGCDIRSKSGLHLRMGYGAFHSMRGECLEELGKGFGNFYEWASIGGSGLLPGIEAEYPNGERELQLPWKTGPLDFSMACNELLRTWMKAHNLGFAWQHFFCHCDCEGGWNAKQVKRLVKDLDQMRGGKEYGGLFDRVRQVFRDAAERGEGLVIS